jgi:hypothetical protein
MKTLSGRRFSLAVPSMIRLLFAFLVVQTFNLATAAVTIGFEPNQIVSPRVAVTHDEMMRDLNGRTCASRMHNWFPDAALVALDPTKSTMTWFSSGFGTLSRDTGDYDPHGVRVRKTSGNRWSPMEESGSDVIVATCKRGKDTCDDAGDASSSCVPTTEQDKQTEYAFRSFNGLTDVKNLWFTNFYHIGGDEYIGFIHEETPLPGTCSKPGIIPKQWRIGLAYSNDSGVSWKYLGRSIEGHTPNNLCDRDGDFSGAYAIYNNEIYIYYNDVNDADEIGVGVARAHLPTVIWAAKNSVHPGFTKLIGPNLWCEQAASSTPGCNPAFVYAGWPQNVFNGGHSVTNGKFYTPGAGIVGTPASLRHVVQLFEQDYPWSTATVVGTLTDEPASAFGEGGGHWYGSSLPGNATLENNEFDGDFGLIIYFTRFREEKMQGQRGVYRWEVYTGWSSGYKHSGDFSSINGGANPWLYRHLSASNGSWSSLIWDPFWGRYYSPNPIDTYAFLDRFGMHNGSATHAGLWWKAPFTGTVNVRFTVRKGSVNCGDGVIAVFSKVRAAGEEVQYMNTLIEYNDVLGQSYFGSIPVVANDHLIFRTDPRTNCDCDYVLWDPWIGYSALSQP